MEPRPILPGSCRMPFPVLRRFRPAQRSRQTPAETGSETASRSRGPHWVHPRLKRECGHIVQWKSSPSQDRRSRRLGLGDHRQCDRLGVGDHDRRQQAIISADFALRDARQIEIRRHDLAALEEEPAGAPSLSHLHGGNMGSIRVGRGNQNIRLCGSRCRRRHRGYAQHHSLPRPMGFRA
jgi:hypothetical protein